MILSQFYGANDQKNVRSALHTSMALALTLGLLVTAVGMAFAPQILHLIGTPDTCFHDALRYCRIYFSGSIATMVYNMGSGILRAMGDSKRPMLFLIVCCLVNILGDLVLVCGFQLGVAGAGIATVSSQVISAALVLWALRKQPEESKLHPGQIRFHGNLLKSTLRIGIPAGIQLMMFDLSNLIAQSSINSFGDATIAAWTTFGKADGITWLISGAFGVSVTTFVGQNFGAQKYQRVRRSVWVCMGLSTGLVGALSILEFIFREPLLSIYSPDPEVIVIGSEMIARIVLFNAVFMPIEVFAGTMRGTGYALQPTIIMCICVCLFRVLWFMLVVSRYHTVAVLTMAYPISWILCAVVFYIVYLRGNWLTSRIEALGLEPEQK